MIQTFTQQEDIYVKKKNFFRKLVPHKAVFDPKASKQTNKQTNKQNKSIMSAIYISAQEVRNLAILPM